MSRLGGAIVSLVEPHPGEAAAFNRWYERDHFHAGCMAGPGFFAGRRFVATRALKALRHPAGAPGSYLALYWLDAEEEAIAWSVETFHGLRGAGRIFQAADLVHAGFYRAAWVCARDADGVPAPLALDHPFAGLVLTQVDSAEPEALADWHAREVTRGAVALSVGLAPRARPDGAVRAASPSEGRTAWLHFLDADPAHTWQEVFSDHGARVEAAGVGRVTFASPFLPTIPGTDRYADEV